MKFIRLPRSLGQPNYQLYSIVITKFIYISYSTHKYSMKFTNIIVINITRYAYLHAFASFFQKPLLNKGNKVIMRIIIMCVSVYLGIRNTACCVCVYAFASFLQKPLSKFIHECSYCAVFVILCVSVFRTPVKLYWFILKCSYSATIKNFVMYIYSFVVRSFRKPYQSVLHLIRHAQDPTKFSYKYDCYKYNLSLSVCLVLTKLAIKVYS